MSVRMEKVASLIRHELGSMISRDYSGGELGFSTVTEVRMTPDLKIAKVYVSIYGPKEQKEKTLARLQSEKAEIRSQLGKRISLKFTPAIQFLLDETMDRVEGLEHLIKQIHRDDRTAG